MCHFFSSPSRQIQASLTIVADEQRDQRYREPTRQIHRGGTKGPTNRTGSKEGITRYLNSSRVSQWWPVDIGMYFSQGGTR